MHRLDWKEAHTHTHLQADGAAGQFTTSRCCGAVQLTGSSRARAVMRKARPHPHGTGCNSAAMQTSQK